MKPLLRREIEAPCAFEEGVKAAGRFLQASFLESDSIRFCSGDLALQCLIAFEQISGLNKS